MNRKIPLADYSPGDFYQTYYRPEVSPWKAPIVKLKDILTLPTGRAVPIDPTQDAQTCYRSRKVRRHTMALHTFDMDYEDAQTNRKFLDIVNLRGEVTDEFFGTRNDFNEFFAERAETGDPFFVVCYTHKNTDPYQVIRANRVSIRSGNRRRQYIQQEDMSWRAVGK